MRKKLLFAVVAAFATLTACNRATTSSNAPMSALDAIATRVSVRAYESKPVEAPVVEQLLRAAMAAPSARNRQPWSFVVINDPQQLRLLADSLPYAKMLASAPLAIVVCGDPEIGGEWWVQDCSAATQNLLLAAHALGLGAVWTGVYPVVDRVRAVRGALQIPSQIIPLALVPIGYPAENPAPKQKWDPGKVRYN